MVVSRGGGSIASACNDTAFANGPLDFVETFSGGPALRDRSDLEIAGVAAADVRRVSVVDSLGRTHLAPLTRQQAFFFALDRRHLAAGVMPTALVAYGADGAELARLDVSEPSP